MRRAPLPRQFSGQCLTDLLTLDGSPVGVRLTGTTADATALHPVDVSLCDPGTSTGRAPTVNLGAGEHLVRSAPGTTTGIDVDGLVVASDAGGGAMALGPRGTLPSSFGATNHASPGSGPGATPRL